MPVTAATLCPTTAPTPTCADAAIELRSINKRFGSVHANRDVSLKIERGSITGIVGENGAGKSTLMNILYGLHEADTGAILIDGNPVRMTSPRDAIAAGIGMVHQHFMLIDTFTVLENVILGAELGPHLGKSRLAARQELERLGREYDLKVNPDALVGDLPVGEQQRVEIIKVLYRGGRILILDEPTGVLTPQETDQLFRMLQTLKELGATVVLITHKLREIMAVTDTVFVMRRGQIVASRVTADTTREELAEMMVGRKVRLELDKSATEPGTAMLVARDLCLEDVRGVKLLDSIDLTLRAGEIVGIAGVSGNGQTELLEVLSGIRQPTTGNILIGDREIGAARPSNPAEMRALGVAHVPEDRLRFAMVGSFEASESSVLGYHGQEPFARRGLLHHAAIEGHCNLLMDRFDVRPRRPGLRSASFSGGNQQKLVLAREIAHRPTVLLVGQPTRGVDIGAIEFIHRQLISIRDTGSAILLVSAELDEVMSLADRIIVMFAGRIVGEVDAADADERMLGKMMTNVWTARAADVDGRVS
jgi:simple sugar transport system ATP-binding protein